MSRSAHGTTLPGGFVVGDYVLRVPLGTGGYATVYEAEHRGTGALRALKILHRGYGVSPSMVARFHREVEVLRRLSHPGVVTVEAFGELPPDLRPYYAMELVRGVTLSAVVRERGRLSPEEALEILEPLGDALAAVHRAGIVHRDIKGPNVLVCDEGGRRVIKIIDFGIAKLLAPDRDAEPLTTLSHRLGTPSAMAPEQILGLALDGRADVYAVGVLLFRMLTGRVPFLGDSIMDIEAAHLQTPAPRPSALAPVERAVDDVVLRCLAKHPDDRYDSAPAVAQALRRALAAPPSARGGFSEGAARARALGIHLRVEVGAAGDEDAVLDALEAILDTAERALVAARFDLASLTGTSLLGVRLLPADEGEARCERRRALALAGSLHDAVAARAALDPRLRWLVCAHEDDAVACGARVVSGSILRLAGWVPEDGAGALATRELMGRAFDPGERSPARYLRLRPPPAADVARGAPAEERTLAARTMTPPSRSHDQSQALEVR
jgi:serine/threonine-protein kinase